MVNGLVAGAAGGAAVAITIKAIDQFSRTFTAAEKSLSAIGGAMTAVGIAGAFAIGGLTKVAGQFEQTQIAFTTMLGSGEKATKLLKELADFATKTPFTITGVEQNAKQLLAMGIETKNLLPTLKSLGDISAGLNVPLERLALNFGQVKVQGNLTGRELRDFSIAGVPLVAELAKNLNVSEEAIADMVSRGKIGFPEVEDAFNSMTGAGGKFFDLMDAQSKTFLGQVSNIQDSLIKIARVMGEVFLPAAKFVAEQLSILIGWFEEHPKLAIFAAVLLAVTTGLLLIAGPILFLVAMLPPLIAGFATLTAVTLPITLTVLAIAAAIIVLIAAGALLIAHWDGFKEVLANLSTGFKNTFIGIANIVLLVWNGIVDIVESRINSLVSNINFLIRQINRIPGIDIGTIENIDLSKFKSDMIDFDLVNKYEKETEAIVEQIEAVEELTNAQKAVNAGLKFIPATGDVYDPTKGFSSSDFDSKFAYEQAKKGGGYTITIENVYGVDPEEISRALSNELNNKLSN